MRIKKSIFFVLIICISGCSSFRDASFKNNRAKGDAGIVRINQFTNNKKDSVGTFMWSHYDATKRGSLMYIDKGGKIRVLAENPPDAAVQSITNIIASAKVDGKVDASLAYKTSKSIVELGKRTAGVNMLRDALYRLNEMYYATKDEKEKNLKFLLKNKDAFTKYNVTGINHDFKLTSINSIDELFTKVIDNAKEIAIKEAEAEITISRVEYPKFEAEKINSEKEKIKMEIFKDMYERVKDTLTKKEIIKYLEKFNKE